MNLRSVAQRDHAGIDAVLAAAFGGTAEVMLVANLRRDGDMVIESLAEIDGRIVAHIAYSRLVAPKTGLALAPLAVEPAYQHRGIGTALVRDTLHKLEEADASWVFVLGDPNFYPRFGFSPNLAVGWASPYAGPAFMALELTGRAIPSEPAIVIHAPAFAEEAEKA